MNKALKAIAVTMLAMMGFLISAMLWAVVANAIT